MCEEQIQASVLKHFFLPMEEGRIIRDRENETTILLVVHNNMKAAWLQNVLNYESKHGILPPSIISEPISADRIFDEILDLHGNDYPHGIPSWVTSRPRKDTSLTIINRIKKTAKIECLGFSMTQKCEKCDSSRWECIALGPFDKGAKCSRCTYAGRPCSLTNGKAVIEKEDNQVTAIVSTTAAALGMAPDQSAVGLWETYAGAP